VNYSFSVVRVLRISQKPFIAVSLGFLVLSVATQNVDGILISIVAVALFSLFHSITRGSYVDLRSGEMEIKFGFFALFRLHYDVIESATIVKHPWIYGLGIRYLGKRTLAFVTDTENVVELTFREVQPIKLSVFPKTFHVRAIRLSIEDVDAFLGELRENLNPSHRQKS